MTAKPVGLRIPSLPYQALQAPFGGCVTRLEKEFFPLGKIRPINSWKNEIGSKPYYIVRVKNINNSIKYITENGNGLYNADHFWIWRHNEEGKNWVHEE